MATRKKTQRVKTDTCTVARRIVTVVLLVVSLLSILLIDDCGRADTLRWLLALFFVSILMRPALATRALDFYDGGFAPALGLGCAISFGTAWYFSATKVCAFDAKTCLCCVFFLGLGITILSVRGNTRFKWTLENMEKMLLGYAVFVSLFVIAYYVKGFKPYIDYQTEQYMDFGFMQAMFRQHTVPPMDIWYSGSKLNYYYLGQAFATFLCQISLTTPEYGYNLSLITLFAGLSTMVVTLTGAILGCFKKIKPFNRIIGSVIAGAMAACGGNGHYIYFGIIKPFYEKVTGREISDYWFPSSTTYIGFDPETDDKGKHEFPSYTFILGDLHAHVCNMFFVLPLLTLLFDYAAWRMTDEGQPTGREVIFREREERESSGKRHTISFKSFTHQISRIIKCVDIKWLMSEIFTPYVLLVGFLLGLFQGINYWDFPIYYVVAGGIILFMDLKTYGMSVRTIALVLTKGLVIWIVGTAFMAPFNIEFSKMMSGIGLCDRHSPIDKFLLLWGIPIAIALGLLIIMYKKKFMDKRKFTYMELAIIAMTLCAIGLLLVPEVVYVKDIYGDTYQRYNTMFKMTFQAFILQGIVAGIATAFFMNRDSDATGAKRYVVYGCLTIAITAILSSYIVTSSKRWFPFGDDRSGISALDYLESDEYEVEYETLKVLLQDARKDLTILEAAGDSYSEDNRISAFAGVSSVMGWYVHEWLWRDSSEIPARRGEEVRKFYECGDKKYCAGFIDRYGVDYILVGKKENERYEVDQSGFSFFGTPAWMSDDGEYTLWEVDREAARNEMLYN